MRLDLSNLIDLQEKRPTTQRIVSRFNRINIILRLLRLRSRTFC